MKQVFLVGLGGAVGSVARFQIGLWLSARFPGATLPATLWINVSGCFVIGVLAALGEKRGVLTPEIRALLMTGVLGGFTTFSTFGLDAFAFLRGEKVAMALIYLGLSVVGGVSMVALGWAMVGFWLRGKSV